MHPFLSTCHRPIFCSCITAVLSPHVSPQCVFRPGGEEEDGPFVWTERELRVRVRCRVRRVEMLGVTDGRSLKALVAQLNPLKLALVGGGAAEAS